MSIDWARAFTPRNKAIYCTLWVLGMSICWVIFMVAVS